MSEVREHHRRAMDLCERAVQNRLFGNTLAAAADFREAFEEERIAVRMAKERSVENLTLAILHQSAAALAFDCGETDQARSYVISGLDLEPPREIAEELTQILVKIDSSKQAPSPKSFDHINSSHIGLDVEIMGSMKFINDFVFDGYLEGEISSVDGILTIGEYADVRGEVRSKTVIVKGKVHGNITVQERCELHSRSQLIGDLKAARLVIEQGATFVGRSEVTPNKIIVKDLGAPRISREEAEKSSASR
jgi:cytoskeletal protein CcmA (bactofilin family)